MLDKPNMMLKQLDLLIKDKRKFDNYIKNGYQFHFDLNNFDLIITYKSKEYTVSLIEIEQEIYWHLIPYNHSQFNSQIENGIDIVLFAIKENEELYSKQ